MAEVFIGDGVIFSTQGRHPDSQRTYRSDSSRKAAEAAAGRAGERQLRLGRRDRGGRPAGSRPRRRGRHHQLRQGHRPDRDPPAQRGRADPDLVAPDGAVGLHLERAGRDAQYLHRQGGRHFGSCGPPRSTPTKPLLQRWHAERNPSHAGSRPPCARSARRARIRPSATSISPPACCRIRRCMPMPCATGSIEQAARRWRPFSSA